MREHQPDSRTAVGVLGVGAIGQHHARVSHERSNVNLVGVYDVDVERATAVAARHGTEAKARPPTRATATMEVPSQ